MSNNINFVNILHNVDNNIEEFADEGRKVVNDIVNSSIIKETEQVSDELINDIKGIQKKEKKFFSFCTSSSDIKKPIKPMRTSDKITHAVKVLPTENPKEIVTTHVVIEPDNTQHKIITHEFTNHSVTPRNTTHTETTHQIITHEVTSPTDQTKTVNTTKQIVTKEHSQVVFKNGYSANSIALLAKPDDNQQQIQPRLNYLKINNKKPTVIESSDDEIIKKTPKMKKSIKKRIKDSSEDEEEEEESKKYKSLKKKIPTLPLEPNKRKKYKALSLSSSEVSKNEEEEEED